MSQDFVYAEETEELKNKVWESERRDENESVEDTVTDLFIVLKPLLWEQVCTVRIKSWNHKHVIQN